MKRSDVIMTILLGVLWCLMWFCIGYINVRRKIYKQRQKEMLELIANKEYL